MLPAAFKLCKNPFNPQVAEGLLLVENLLAALLAVLRRNSPASKLGNERVRHHEV